MPDHASPDQQLLRSWDRRPYQSASGILEALNCQLRDIKSMSGNSDKYEVSERTKVKRIKDRGKYDKVTVHSILDEAFIAHVGFVKDGFPLVLPMGYARDGENLLLHGSITNAMLKNMKGEVDVCITVTLTDGVVVARSAFHHSLNYRSVVALGKAQAVTDPAEKTDALNKITDHLLPGRVSEVRANSKAETNATLVLRLKLEEVSAKVRTGFPKDDEKDYQLTDVWAGILPFAPMQTMEPINDERLLDGIQLPKSVSEYRRPSRKA